MYKFIKHALSTATFRQTIITTSATFIIAFLGAVYYLFIARLLTPSEYGLFTLAISIALAAISIADFGTGQTLVKFVAQHKDSTEQYVYAKISLLVKAASGSFFLLLFIFFSRVMADRVLHQPQVAPLIPIAGLSVLALLLLSFPSDYARGRQRFFLWGGVQIGSNLFRMLLMFTLFAFASLTSSSAIFTFAASPLLFFLISWFWLDRSILTAHIDRTHLVKFWSFNRWTSALIIATAITSRLDTFLAARYLDLTQIGIYGLASTMSFFMPQLSGALGAVTAAKFASFSDGQHAAKYMRKATLFTTVTSISVALLMVPTAVLVIWFTNRTQYWESLPSFLVLLLAMTIFTSMNPIRDSLFYFHARPDFFFWVAIAQGLAIIASGVFLIPHFGVIGAALTVLVSHILLAIVCIWYYRRLCQK